MRTTTGFEWLNPREGRIVAVAVALLITQFGLVCYSATRHSPVLPEPALLAAGVAHWELGRFELYRVNPPLVRMVAAIPAVLIGCNTDYSSVRNEFRSRPEFAVGDGFFALNGEHSFRMLVMGRWSCALFALLGGCFAFCYSREVWGSGEAALLTLGVWCLEPNILANAEFITNDLASGALGIGATWTFWRWLQVPTWGRAGVAGGVMGIAQLTKSSWIILFALWPILAGFWWARQWHSSGTRAIDRRGVAVLSTTGSAFFTQLFFLLSISLYVLNLGYGFDGTFSKVKEFEFVSAALGGDSAARKSGNIFRGSWFEGAVLPLPRQYILGIDMQKADFESWRREAFLRGESRIGGWWYYYLYGFVVKVPHGIQVILLLAVFSGAAKPFRRACFRLSRGWRLFPKMWNQLALFPSKCDSPAEMAVEGQASQPCLEQYSGSALDQAVMVLPMMAHLLFVSSQSNINEHFRYALPVICMSTVYAGRCLRAPR